MKKRFLVFQTTLEIDRPLTEREIDKLTENIISGMTEELEVNRKDGLIDDYRVEHTQNEEVDV